MITKKTPLILCILVVLAIASSFTYYRIYTGPFQRASAEYTRRYPDKNLVISTCMFCRTNLNTGDGVTTYRFAMEVRRGEQRSLINVILRERDGTPVSMTFEPY